MHQGFLSAIRDDPDSDEPRLIYADWLEDNGNPDRAEFIRVQCRLATMEGDEAEFFDLQERQWSLLAKNQDDWLHADFPVRVYQRNHEFKRGFLRWALCAEHEFITFKAFNQFTGAGLRLSHGESFKRLVDSPRLKQVSELSLERCMATAQDLTSLLRSPHLGPLVRLELPGYYLPAVANELADCAGLSRVTDLSLAHLREPDPVFEQMALSPHFAALRHLRLTHYGQMGTNGLQALGRSTHLTGLRTLELPWRSGNQECAAIIGTSSALARLERLNLGGNNSNDQGVSHLARSRHLGTLTYLDLTQNGLVTAPSILAHSTGLPNLRTLNLSFNSLRPGTVRELLVSDALPALRVLGLMQTNLSASELAAPGVSRLTSLSLGNNSGPDAGYATFFQSQNLSRLRTLNLAGVALGTRAVISLKHAALEQLHVLILDRIRFTEAGMKELAAAPALKNVRRLSLSWCSLGDAATEVLLRSPHLVNLRELDLTGNNLSGHLMPLLADQLPRLHTLILTNNRLLDQGMRRLVDHPGATKFRVLNLSSTALSPPGGLALANSPHLDGLAQLTVSGQALGFEASKALRKRFGTRVSL